MGRESPTQPPEVIDHRVLMAQARVLAARIDAIVDVLTADLEREPNDEQPT